MTLIAILGTSWLVILGAVVALCRGARRGDELLVTAQADDLVRRRVSAGIVHVDMTAAEIIGGPRAGDLRTRVSGQPGPDDGRAPAATSLELIAG